MTIIRALTVAAVAMAATGCAAIPAAMPATPGATPVLAPCPPGEITMWGDDPTGCDLVGGVNTLTILGITEPACDAHGGDWWYEACLRADF